MHTDALTTRLVVLALLGAVAANPADAQSGAGSPPPRLSTVLSIGADAGSGSVEFNDVMGIAVHPNGDFYVLDAGNRTVHRFSRDGRQLGRFGREGSGPGEFLFPVAVTVDSVVRVLDARHARASVFALDGTHKQTARFRVPDGLPIAVLHPLANGLQLGETTARLSWGRPEHSADQHILMATGDGTRIDTLLTFNSGVTVWYTPGAAAPWSVARSRFGQSGAMAISGDTLVAVADGYGATVTWYAAEGEHLVRRRTAQLPGTVRPVTDGDVADVERDFRAANPREGRVAFAPPPSWSIATRALFDGSGRLWVENGLADEHGAVWAIFSADGVLARRLRLPAGFTLYAVREPYLYGTVKSALDVQSIRVYRLHE
jgi:hypothetical protein